MHRMVVSALVSLLAMASAGAGRADENLRIATWAVDLTRRGPGLMLRDIERGDPLVRDAVATIVAADPDVLLLTGFDWDRDLIALTAFAALLADAGAAYPDRFALRPNTGIATGLDLNGDGRVGDPADAQGYGRFTGAEGMAILSRLPIVADQARDFSVLLWRDMPGAVLPQTGGRPFPSAAAQAVQRLSTTAHWDVAVMLPGGRVLHLLAFAATPPLFDGAEDRNGLRNAAEIGFWQMYLDGALPWPPPVGPFVILGDANLDPQDGDGRHGAIRALLADPRIQDAAPASEGARRAGTSGPNGRHRGDPAQDTADWTTAWRGDDAPGNLRVDYVLPSRDLAVLGSGVLWPHVPAGPIPEPGSPEARLPVPTRHGLVWVDVAVQADPAPDEPSRTDPLPKVAAVRAP